MMILDPQVMGEQACVRGMRITASLEINHVANGIYIPEIIKSLHKGHEGDTKAHRGFSSCNSVILCATLCYWIS